MEAESSAAGAFCAANESPQAIEAASHADEQQIPTSKKQLKRMLKAQRNEELKHVRRKAERERKKARKAAARLSGDASSHKPHIIDPRKQRPFGASIVVDCGFDELMTDKEIASMSAQLSSIQCSNRRAKRPFAKIVIAGQGRKRAKDYAGDEQDSDERDSKAMKYIEPEESPATPLLQGRLGRRMDVQMRGCWHRWPRFHLREHGGLEQLDKDVEAQMDGEINGRTGVTSMSKPLCAKDKMVYLTADTDDTLATLEEGSAYIIGGIVDRNRHKHICARKARALGIRTARLPIPPRFLKTSSVMTINQVFDILLTFNETQDWTAALERCLPQRKRAHRPCQANVEAGAADLGHESASSPSVSSASEQDHTHAETKGDGVQDASAEIKLCDDDDDDDAMYNAKA